MSNISLETPSQQRSHTQKRWHKRKAVPEMVTLTWRDKNEQEKVHKCRILDLSRWGMCVSLPYKLEFRSFIHIRAPKLKLVGVATIRHQKPEKLNYITGIEFVGGLFYDQANPLQDGQTKD